MNLMVLDKGVTAFHSHNVHKKTQVVFHHAAVYCEQFCVVNYLDERACLFTLPREWKV